MPWLKYALLLLLLLLAISIPLAKQLNQNTPGSIEGIVVDEIGVSIPQARVEARSMTHQSFYSAVSGSNGFYRFADLRPGKYSLSATAGGHASEWIPLVIVEEGGPTRQDIRLAREVGIRPTAAGR